MFHQIDHGITDVSKIDYCNVVLCGTSQYEPFRDMETNAHGLSYYLQPLETLPHWSASKMSLLAPKQGTYYLQNSGFSS